MASAQDDLRYYRPHTLLELVWVKLLLMVAHLGWAGSMILGLTEHREVQWT